jgi:hypothetical protein
MPFIGRDWRANGEQWTKTDIGSWERPRRISLSSSVRSSRLTCDTHSFFATVFSLVHQLKLQSLRCI